MRRIKSEKGAITIIVLVSILFLVSFLISSYVIVANRLQAQKEILEQTRKTYETGDMKKIYNSYFSGETIPIYNAEQLIRIGSGNTYLIDNKYYVFAQDSTYILMEDIVFDSRNLEDLNGVEWIPIGNVTQSGFVGHFEGNGHIIEVTDLDGINHIYSEANNYGGLCNLSIITIPDDTNITVAIDGQTQTGKLIVVPYYTTINYIATKEGYIEETDSILITQNTNLEINLKENQS